jgi:PAS domain S-box-containing protein
MASFPSYHLDAQLYNSPTTAVYRARRARDRQPVILKVLRDTAPERLAAFKREYDVLRTLNLPGVVQAYGLEHEADAWIMVLEDFDGESLARLQLAGRLAIADFLHLALAMTETLRQVHQQRVIHKHVTPENIVLNPATGEVKLIDFGMATVLSREVIAFRNSSVLEGTLAYLAPEQTGRMNRAMDERADFYALGVTFYELLTGHVPFTQTDPMELLHAHLALTPPAPHIVNAAVPLMLSEIVLKLLAKNAAERYQSAGGLQGDLVACLRQRQVVGRIAPFTLGRHEVIDRFHLPQKLYGREQAISTLRAAFDRVCAGRRELWLVVGYSGIGKSALVQELYTPITQQRGFFIAGKYDQLQRNIPYSALIQAFQRLLRHLSTDSEAALAAWRNTLRTALEPNGQLIVEILPELEVIVGPQPAVADVPPAEASNRFYLVLRNFLRAFARPEHPLVIFLDDLQWADAASLRLLRTLGTAPDLQHLFLIGAYRDHEVDAAHPLRLMLDDMRKIGAIVHHLSLPSLTVSHVTQWLSDALACALDRAAPLASFVHTKTGGNPFFCTEFLHALYADGLLTFDHAQGVWQWDMMRLERRDLADNVVDLLVDKVQQCRPATQQALQLAACIGNQFDLWTLAVVHEKSPREAAADLWEAVIAGLLVPLSDACTLMAQDVLGLAEAMTAVYRFVHDHVQQAVYARIPDADKQAVHYRVGQLLWRNTPPAAREEHMFDVVHQLNLGRSLLAEQTVRDEVAALNLAAGRRASASAAYAPAFCFLQTGLELAGAEVWERDYALALALHTDAAEAAYLSGHFDTMERLTDDVLLHTRDVVDNTRVYEIRVRAYAMQSKYDAALQAGLEGLRLLGVEFPPEPGHSHIQQGIQAMYALLAAQPIERLAALPEMTEPRAQVALLVLNGLLPITYRTMPALTLLMVFQMVALSAHYGNAAPSPHAYASLGAALCAYASDYQTSARLDRLATQLLEQRNAAAFRCRTLFAIHVFLRYWTAPLSATLDGLREAYYSGLETGDFEYARYVLGLHCFHAFHCGRELGWMEQALATAADVYVRDNQVRTFSSNRLYHQVVLNLLGQADDPTRLVGTRYDETHIVPQHLEDNNFLAVFRLYLNRAFLQYLFGQPASALESVTLAAQYVEAAVGMFEATLLCVYDSLILLAVAAGATPEAQAPHLEKVATNQRQLHTWGQAAPMNFLHKFHLVEAERARVEGRAAEAREHYDAAIALAQRHGYLNDEALAYELAAQFYLARGQSRLANHYLRDARAAYARWGAHAKVTDLEARYPHLAATPHATSVRAHTLDIGSLLKASQAIAAETHLDRLLARLMRVVIENAGAQAGSLLLPHNGQWIIQAEAAVGDEAIRVLHARAMEDAPVPLSLVTHVLRTHENVLLDDAARLGDFTADPQIVARQLRSILCMPLLQRGQLIGLLYLENNLTPGAFTPDRLEMLQALAGQAAIALENARQAEALRQAEAKYRRIFEGALEGIFQTTPDGRLLTANPALAQMAGCASPETLLAHVTSITEAYVEPRRRVELLHLLEEHGEARNFEAEMYRKDGSTMWVSMNVRRVQTPDGTVYFEGFVQDITERRRAEAERRKQDALRQAHDELERRVRQRTAALAKANADLRAEVAERQRAEAALRANLSLVQAIIDGTTDAIFVKDLRGRYVMINAAGAQFFGKPVQEILGQDDTALFSPDTAAAIIAGDRRVLRSGITQTYEDVGTSMGITRTYLSTKGIYRDRQGTVIGLFGISRDITERKQTDERIKASLHEKEVLLKEIHHRVKNNLQIISSLLSLQTRYLKVPQAQHALEDSKNRVKSIALLHELLYQSKDIARIDFAQYIKNIILQLFHAYDIDANTVTFEINTDDRVLEIDAAIPFGLIINELVSNALKHAFPGGRKGKITIELSGDDVGVTKMIVSDNGIGFPRGLDLRTMNSLGLKLVTTLTHQLSGTIELDRTAGAQFTFSFGHLHIQKG